MLLATLLSAASLLASVDAFPGLNTGGVYGNWAPAGPTDSRSPCPGLNSLANHGFFPHNGRGISYIDFIITCAVYLGVGPTVTATVAPFGIIAGPLGDLTLDLNSLNEHNYIEHDCSTWHNDQQLGNNHIPNITLFEQMVNLMPAGATTVDFGTIVRAHAARVSDSQRDNPGLRYGPIPLFFTYLECAMVMHVTGGPLLPRPPIEYVYSFVMDERLPAHLGWSPHVMTDIEVFAVFAILELAASPNLVTELAVFGTSTIRAILDGTIITGIINGVGGGGQTYKQGEGNVMPDGSISKGTPTPINSNSGLLGPIIGGFANLIGGNVQSLIGSFVGKPPAAPPGQNAGENSVIGLVNSIAANGGKLPTGMCAGGCPQEFAKLINNGQGVDLDPAHVEAMWGVPQSQTYHGAGKQESANLALIQKFIGARVPHSGPAWDPATAKAPRPYVPPTIAAAAPPKASASVAPAAQGGIGGWIKGIFGGHR
ncbi:hypothetical protein RQP46_005613 [Phenoliferia psychrophenolica]